MATERFVQPKKDGRKKEREGLGGRNGIFSAVILSLNGFRVLFFYFCFFANFFGDFFFYWFLLFELLFVLLLLLLLLLLSQQDSNLIIFTDIYKYI